MKSFVATALMLAVAAGPTFAQRHKVNINTETPEGQLLQQIGQESDETKKLALLDQFAAKYPKDESVGWVYSQMQPAYVKAGQFDKAIDVGEKLLALDPEDLETAHETLKAAEAKKDPDMVKKWSARTAGIAQKIVASAQPKEEDEVEAWKRRVDYARQTRTYSEYALYAMAAHTPDFTKKIELVEALRQQNPKSEYVPKAMPQLYLGYRQTGQNDKALAVAEQVVATDQSDEDMLLVVADGYLQKKRDPEKVLAYSAKMMDIIKAKPKPEGASDADWEKRKKLILGLGHLMTGKVYFNQNKFAAADTSLREALPLIESNAQVKADTLFHLGWANYKMEKIQEAANFNRQCAAIKSPYQAQAAKNLAAIRQQYQGVR